ncbi:MAG: hypothetical protein HDT50_07390 [Lactobacillus sp.]|nr:hypothetical protein [Lactobacillus sp.]
MTLLEGAVSALFLLVLCRFIPTENWRLLLYYYVISNYLMLYPYNQENKSKAPQVIAQEETSKDDQQVDVESEAEDQPLRRSRKRTKQQLDTELLNNLLKSFALTCVDLVLAPFYFMRSYLKK